MSRTLVTILPQILSQSTTEDFVGPTTHSIYKASRSFSKLYLLRIYMASCDLSSLQCRTLVRDHYFLVTACRLFFLICGNRSCSIEVVFPVSFRCYLVCGQTSVIIEVKIVAMIQTVFYLDCASHCRWNSAFGKNTPQPR